MRWTDPVLGGGCAWFDNKGNFYLIYSGFGAYTVHVPRVRPLQGGHGVVTWPGCGGAASANLGVLGFLAGGFALVATAAGGAIGSAGAFIGGMVGIGTGIGAMSPAACPTPQPSEQAPGNEISGPDIDDALGGLSDDGGTVVVGDSAPDGGGRGVDGSDPIYVC